MSVDGGKRVLDADGNLIRAGVELAIDAINNSLSGGTKAPNARQQEALIAAGYELQPTRGRYPVQNWEGPDGTVYGPGTSRRIALELLRNPPAAAPPAAPPPSATGPTVPDGAGFPISIPLPNIPGLPSTLPIPAIPPAALPVVLGPIIAGGLLYPISAGRGSDLRDLYGMPQPKPKGRRRRRRSTRTRARPVAIPGRGNPFPATVPKGRKGPVTISRPAAARAPPIAVPGRNPYTPGKKIPGVKIDVGPIKAPMPAKIPRTPAQTAAAAAGAVLGLPGVKDLLRSVLGSGLGSLFVNSPSARLGRINLPNTIPSPLPLTNPLTASQAQPLPYAAAFPATRAATQEQDCSCRPVRKKSNKKRCKNPVTSRRSFKRGSKRFVTTTKELKCQA